jgi:NADPH2:quinone reductase
MEGFVLAITYRDCGPAHQVLVLDAISDPLPGAGEVRVRLHYSGVNPTDWKRRAAENPRFGEFQVPHQDGSGVIDLVGAGVDPSRVGERVWLYHASTRRPYGTAAELICLPSSQAVRLPDHTSFQQGATLGIPYLTAAHALSAIPSEPGRILVTGGAGAVGHASVQLARHLGYEVVTTVSTEAKAAIARTAGPDQVLRYLSDRYPAHLAEACGDGFTGVIDVDLGANVDSYAPLLQPGGHIVCYASDDSPDSIPSRTLMFRNASIDFFVVYELPEAAIRHAVDMVSRMLEAGDMTMLPIHEYHLEDVAQAHDDVQAGLVGRALIRID